MSEVPNMDLVAYVRRQREWSRATFGPGDRLGGVLDHLAKELREVRADPRDIYEWCDLIILALDGAWRQGFEPEDIALALINKQGRNVARVWPDWRTRSEDEAIEHDRTVEVDQIGLAEHRHATGQHAQPVDIHIHGQVQPTVEAITQRARMNAVLAACPDCPTGPFPSARGSWQPPYHRCVRHRGW